MIPSSDHRGKVSLKQDLTRAGFGKRWGGGLVCVNSTSFTFSYQPRPSHHLLGISQRGRGEHNVEGSVNAVSLLRRCPSTVLCTVPSCESADLRWLPTWEPTKSNRFRALRVRFGGVPSAVEEVVRGQFCYLFERPPQETQAEQYSNNGLITDIILTGQVRNEIVPDLVSRLVT